VNQPLFRKATVADRKDRWSWHLGRILGIPTRIHASFALVLLWVGVSAWRSAQSGYAVLFGLGFVLAIFACVLLHEFGHALVARRFGIETRRITLLPIGGVAELERSPEEPRAELWIAAAGPAVNLVIAAVLGAVGWATGAFAGAGLVNVVFTGLIWANLMLALFNLIPAFPMDGGRVFRAWAAGRWGRLRATQIAAKLGRWLAVGFGAWGLFGGNPVLALIAVFVWFAAGRELAAVEQQAVYEREREAWARARVAQAYGFDRATSRGGFDRATSSPGFDRATSRGGFDRATSRGGFGFDHAPVDVGVGPRGSGQGPATERRTATQVIFIPR
jgi:Zn-dependent protease